MPTGYTAALCEKDESFETFIMRCAREFGALVIMREEPLGASVPEKFEPSDWNFKEFEKARDQHVKVAGMSDEECAKEALKEFQANMGAFRDAVEKAAAIRRRLLQMRKRVEEWRPPSPTHEGLKTFMFEQLDVTIESEGTVSKFWFEQIKSLSGPEWREKVLASLDHDVKYHHKQNEEEIERTRSRNKWLAELRASLKAPV